MEKDYYKILRVHPSVSSEEIQEAYRRLAHKHHPDKGGDAEQFKQVHEAYEILSDPYKRGRYDATVIHDRDITQRPNPSPSTSPQPQTVYVKKEGLTGGQITLIIIGIIIVLIILAG